MANGLENKETSLPSASRSRALLKTRDYALSLLLIAVALIASLSLKQHLAASNIALMLLVTVQIVAIAYGLGPALMASIASALAYNFFFIPPLYTFTVAEPENVVTL